MSLRTTSFRIITFLVLIVVLFLTSPWLGIVAIFLYALVWPGYELLMIGGTVDLIFGHIGHDSIPMYLLCALISVLVSTWLRPLLTVYEAPTL